MGKSGVAAVLSLADDATRMRGALDAIIATYEQGVGPLDGETGAAKAAALAGRLYKLAKRARTDPPSGLPPSGFPEHDKLLAVAPLPQLLGEFLDWFQSSGFHVVAYETKRGGYEVEIPVHKTVNQWLAEFFAVDLVKIEQEKRAMLARIREGA